MGHRQFGKLPRQKGWKNIIKLLNCSTTSVNDLARRILNITEKEITFSQQNSLLSKLFWQLTRLLWSVKTNSLETALNDAELPLNCGTNIFTLIKALGDSCRSKDIATKYPALDELTALAVQSAFFKVLSSELQPTFFYKDDQELELTLRKISSKTQFGYIARVVLSEYLNRILAYVVSRHDISNADQVNFNDALRNWAWETGLIVEKYSSDWYSKHNYLSKGKIDKNEAKGFIAYALEKIIFELKMNQIDKEEHN